MSIFTMGYGYTSTGRFDEAKMQLCGVASSENEPMSGRSFAKDVNWDHETRLLSRADSHA
jgi:hypothetical protein